MQVKHFFITSVVFCNIVLAGSLWNDSSQSPFVKRSNFKVGDTITVLVDESLSAAQSGTTKSDKTSQTDFDMSNRNNSQSTIGGNSNKSNVDDRLNFGLKGGNSFSGTGKTSRSTAIKATITATVIDVQPNGNLFILGQRQIKVNEEVEQLEVSGIVKVSNISDDNTVFSTQIANAKIVIKGAGVVSNQQQPGVMAKLFDWLF